MVFTKKGGGNPGHTLASKVSPSISVPTLSPMPQTQGSRLLMSGEEDHARVSRVSLCPHGTVLRWKYPTKNRAAVERSFRTEESSTITV